MLLVLRYGSAVVAVATAFGFRATVTTWGGPGLPTYVTFYPAVMVVALLAGFGPGALATALAGLTAAYWILPPEGFAVASSVERLGLVIFTGMGLFMSVVAELYRRKRDKAAAYDREAALRESHARLAAFAEATFEGLVESDAGRIVDCNSQFARLVGYSVDEMRGLDIASLIPPEERDRVMANFLPNRDTTIEHTTVRKDGTRIIVEAHGRPVFPGGANRHTVIRDVTARKQAEAERQKFVSLADQSTEFIGMCDMEFRPFYVNEAGRRLVGLESLEQACRTPVPEFFFPEDQRFITEEFFPRVLRDGRAEVEIRFRHLQTGAAIWMIYNVFYLRDATGQPVGLATVSRNITQRKQTEEVLRFLGQCGVGGSGEGFFQELARYLAQTLDMDFVCVDRLEPDFLSAQTLAVFHDGQFEDNVSYTLRDTPCGTVVGQRICCFPRNVRGLFPRDAVLQDLQAESYLGTTLWSAQGKPLGLIAVIGRQALSDTRLAESILQLVAVRAAGELERLQAEETLRESARLQARAARQQARLVELSARVVAQSSVGQLLATVAEAARELTESRLSVCGHGLTGDEFRVGIASCAEGVSPCPPGASFKVQQGGVYLEVLHGGPSLRLSAAELAGHPAWWGLPTGHAPLCGLLGARLVDAQAQPAGLIMVSDREDGEPFTADDEALLRQLASIASLALGHIEARTAAEEANAAKSRFLANVSHELRTPMNAILGMVDLASQKATDPIAGDFLKTAKGSADLLLTLLNDLLDCAKIEAGKLELEAAPFGLRRMLDQLTQSLAVRAGEKGLAFSCRLPAGTPDALVGDQVRLRQILFNLAGNAIKFTERGEVEVSLGVQSQDAEQVCLEFAVRDTGIGIPQADIGHIFQAFAQADASTTRRFGGTGLGLSICSSLVALMDGRIWVESEVGKGSTFHFTVRLPVAKGFHDELETLPKIPAVAGALLRILLVEDNPANQKLAAYILRDRGHSVDIAGDGRQAIGLAQEHDYDVILMDVQMPGMDGLEATKAIRAAEGTAPSFASDSRVPSPFPPPSPTPPRVPIIAMTAHAMKGDRDHCLAAGMDGYLSKPIDAQELLALVETLGARSQTVVAATSAHAVVEPPRGAVFDQELALKRCANKPKLVAEMIQFFFADADSLLPQMQAALAAGHWQQLGRLGHRLKGTLVYLGAEPAQAAALRLERAGNASGDTPADAEAALGALEHECARLRAALREHLLVVTPTPDG